MVGSPCFAICVYFPQVQSLVSDRSALIAQLESLKQDAEEAQQVARLEAQQESRAMVEQQLSVSEERFKQVQVSQSAELARVQAEHAEELHLVKIQVCVVSVS